MTTPLLYDALFCVILFTSFCAYYKKGLVRSALELLGAIVSAAVAGFLSGRIAPIVYQRFVEQHLTNEVVNQLTQYRDGLLESFEQGFLGDIIGSFVQSPQELGSDLAETATVIVSGSIQSAVTAIIRVVVFLLLFIAVYLLIQFAARLAGVVNHIPVFGFANRLLGALMGVAMALLSLLLIASVFGILLQFFTTSWFNHEVMLQSHLFSHIYRLNPFYT